MQYPPANAVRMVAMGQTGVMGRFNFYEFMPETIAYYNGPNSYRRGGRTLVHRLQASARFFSSRSRSYRTSGPLCGEKTSVIAIRRQTVADFRNLGAAQHPRATAMV